MRNREIDMECPECEAEMFLGNYPVEVRVGRHIVECPNIPHERCPNCAYNALDASTAELLELRSAQVVMHEVSELDLAALKFARKALGLTQTELAKKLSLTQETISRYETAALQAPAEYRLAIAGLLAHEEQVLQGTPLGHVRPEVAA